MERLFIFSRLSLAICSRTFAGWREIEDENRRLKRMYAGLSLGNCTLKFACKSFQSQPRNKRWLLFANKAWIERTAGMYGGRLQRSVITTSRAQMRWTIVTLLLVAGIISGAPCLSKAYQSNLCPSSMNSCLSKAPDRSGAGRTQQQIRWL